MSSPAYLEEPDWVAPLLDDVSAGLVSSRRDEALMLLDGVLHLEQSSRFPGVHPLMHRARYHEPALVGRGRGVGVLVYPGHQGSGVPNCVYLLRTTDGVAVLHTGDESGGLDWDWIDRLGTRQAVDLLLANCW